MSPVPQQVIALDLEGVLTPEIWIAVAEATGADEFLRTTRDEPNYAKLMNDRLAALDRHGIGFSALLGVVDGLDPLPGAVEFLDELRSLGSVVVLSDTFEQLAAPLLAKLGWPHTLCHRLYLVDDRVVSADVRLPEAKSKAIAAYRQLGYQVTAIGDSFNDIAMLRAADGCCLFQPSEPVVAANPDLLVATSYAGLLGVCQGKPLD